MKKIIPFFTFVLCSITAFAQENAASGRISIYLDCVFCDTNYIRTEIKYIEYVTDRTLADIHLLVTTASTGSGGSEYTLDFIGQKRFEERSQKLKFTTEPSSTSDTVRKRLVQHIQLGLMPYLADSPILPQLSITYKAPEAGESVSKLETKDKWNKWSFRVSSNLSADGESQQSRFETSGSLSATRTTENWKTSLSVRTDYDKSTYPVSSKETLEIIKQSYNADASVVRSINNYWSAKISANSFINKGEAYSNVDRSISGRGAVEYSIFPYSEFNRRKIALQYEVFLRNVQYHEETIFGKYKENISGQSIALNTSYNQPWGTLSIGTDASHYFTKYKNEKNQDELKYAMSIFGSISWRIAKGLSLNLYGSLSKVNDQIGLPKEDLTEAEVLLKLKELETSFRYYTHVGVSYRFGSFNNNTVNSRFGGGESFFFFSD